MCIRGPPDSECSEIDYTVAGMQRIFDSDLLHDHRYAVNRLSKGCGIEARGFGSFTLNDNPPLQVIGTNKWGS